MKIYVASSWRNETLQQQVVTALNESGHDVYDFRHPEPGNDGFAWSAISEKWMNWTPSEFREALDNPIAQAGFKLDMDALRACDLCVLVLPCGRSAHLELGWAAGANKRTIVYAPDKIEPELMYLMCDSICTTMGELDAKVFSMDAWPTTDDVVRRRLNGGSYQRVNATR